MPIIEEQAVQSLSASNMVEFSNHHLHDDNNRTDLVQADLIIELSLLKLRRMQQGPRDERARLLVSDCLVKAVHDKVRLLQSHGLLQLMTPLAHNLVLQEFLKRLSLSRFLRLWIERVHSDDIEMADSEEANEEDEDCLQQLRLRIAPSNRRNGGEMELGDTGPLLSPTPPPPPPSPIICMDIDPPSPTQAEQSTTKPHLSNLLAD